MRACGREREGKSAGGRRVQGRVIALECDGRVIPFAIEIIVRRRSYGYDDSGVHGLSSQPRN